MKRKPITCKYCDHETQAQLVVHVFANGSQNFTWECVSCGRKAPTGGPIYIDSDIVRQHLTNEEIKSLPIIMPPLVDRCAHCGQRATEEHHWAPRAIFGPEADRWPTDRLCKTCHDLWHQMVTPQLVKK